MVLDIADTGPGKIVHIVPFEIQLKLMFRDFAVLESRNADPGLEHRIRQWKLNVCRILPFNIDNVDLDRRFLEFSAE
jgi:hypothetical protein